MHLSNQARKLINGLPFEITCDNALNVVVTLPLGLLPFCAPANENNTHCRHFTQVSKLNFQKAQAASSDHRSVFKT